MNRPVAISGDGSAMVWPGRYYRMIVIINGATNLGEITNTFLQLGFVADDLALSLPDEWLADEKCLQDWPEEPEVELAANETLLRVSGSYLGEQQQRIAPDTAIVANDMATITIVAIWHYGEAVARPKRERHPTMRTGQTAEDKSGTALWVGGALVAALAAWRFMKNSKEVDREEMAFHKVAARAEQVRMRERMRELMARGLSEGDANAVALYEELEGEDVYVIGAPAPSEIGDAP